MEGGTQNDCNRPCVVPAPPVHIPEVIIIDSDSDSEELPLAIPDLSPSDSGNRCSNDAVAIVYDEIVASMLSVFPEADVDLILSLVDQVSGTCSTQDEIFSRLCDVFLQMKNEDIDSQHRNDPPNNMVVADTPNEPIPSTSRETENSVIAPFDKQTPLVLSKDTEILRNESCASSAGGLSSYDLGSIIVVDESNAAKTVEIIPVKENVVVKGLSSGIKKTLRDDNISDNRNKVGNINRPEDGLLANCVREVSCSSIEDAAVENASCSINQKSNTDSAKDGANADINFVENPKIPTVSNKDNSDFITLDNGKKSRFSPTIFPNGAFTSKNVRRDIHEVAKLVSGFVAEAGISRNEETECERSTDFLPEESSNMVTATADNPEIKKCRKSVSKSKEATNRLTRKKRGAECRIERKYFLRRNLFRVSAVNVESEDDASGSSSNFEKSGDDSNKIESVRPKTANAAVADTLEEEKGPESSSSTNTEFLSLESTTSVESVASCSSVKRTSSSNCDETDGTAAKKILLDPLSIQENDIEESFYRESGEASSHPAERIDTPPVVDEEGNYECKCCYSDVEFDELVQCREGHLFCCECLRRYTQEAVYGGGKASLTCMSDGCPASFPPSQLRRALPDDLYARYEERVEEEFISLAELEDFVRCKYCNVGAELEKGQNVFTCPNEDCKKSFCRLCKNDWVDHIGLKCNEVEKKDETQIRLEFEEKMAEAKIRQCPKCKAKFTKDSGCNKITCRCGNTICYICRKEKIKYNHFCQHLRQGLPGNKCTQCISCSLWSNAEQDDEMAIRELKNDAYAARLLRGFQESKEIGAPTEADSAPNNPFWQRYFYHFLGFEDGHGHAPPPIPPRILNYFEAFPRQPNEQAAPGNANLLPPLAHLLNQIHNWVQPFRSVPLFQPAHVGQLNEGNRRAGLPAAHNAANEIYRIDLPEENLMYVNQAIENVLRHVAHFVQNGEIANERDMQPVVDIATIIRAVQHAEGYVRNLAGADRIVLAQVAPPAVQVDQVIGRLVRRNAYRLNYFDGGNERAGRQGAQPAENVDREIERYARHIVPYVNEADQRADLQAAQLGVIAERVIGRVVRQAACHIYHAIANQRGQQPAVNVEDIIDRYARHVRYYMDGANRGAGARAAQPAANVFQVIQRVDREQAAPPVVNVGVANPGGLLHQARNVVRLLENVGLQAAGNVNQANQNRRDVVQMIERAVGNVNQANQNVADINRQRNERAVQRNMRDAVQVFQRAAEHIGQMQQVVRQVVPANLLPHNMPIPRFIRHEEDHARVVRLAADHARNVDRANQRADGRAAGHAANIYQPNQPVVNVAIRETARQVERVVDVYHANRAAVQAGQPVVNADQANRRAAVNVDRTPERAAVQVTQAVGKAKRANQAKQTKQKADRACQRVSLQSEQPAANVDRAHQRVAVHATQIVRFTDNIHQENQRNGVQAGKSSTKVKKVCQKTAKVVQHAETICKANRNVRQANQPASSNGQPRAPVQSTQWPATAYQREIDPFNANALQRRQDHQSTAASQQITEKSRTGTASTSTTSTNNKSASESKLATAVAHVPGSSKNLASCTVGIVRTNAGQSQQNPVPVIVRSAGNTNRIHATLLPNAVPATSCPASRILANSGNTCLASPRQIVVNQGATISANAVPAVPHPTFRLRAPQPLAYSGNNGSPIPRQTVVYRHATISPNAIPATPHPTFQLRAPRVLANSGNAGGSSPRQTAVEVQVPANQPTPNDREDVRVQAELLANQLLALMAQTGMRQTAEPTTDRVCKKPSSKNP